MSQPQPSKAKPVNLSRPVTASAPAAEPAAATTRLPTAKVLMVAAKLAMKDDRPIILGYYDDSFNKKAIILKKDGEQMLYKNKEEYTSPIANVFKVDGEMLVLTENSVYIVNADIPSKSV